MIACEQWIVMPPKTNYNANGELDSHFIFCNPNSKQERQ